MGKFLQMFFEVFSIRYFVPFGVFSIRCFLLFHLLSHLEFFPFNVLSRLAFFPFDVLSHSAFCHSAFCLSTFFPLAFFHSTFFRFDVSYYSIFFPIRQMHTYIIYLLSIPYTCRKMVQKYPKKIHKYRSVTKETSTILYMNAVFCSSPILSQMRLFSMPCLKGQGHDNRMG
jgi:hypothetical protein